MDEPRLPWRQESKSREEAGGKIEGLTGDGEKLLAHTWHPPGKIKIKFQVQVQRMELSPLLFPLPHSKKRASHSSHR
jgi:hypothetical protein